MKHKPCKYFLRCSGTVVVSHALAVLPIFNRQHSMRFRSTLCCSHFMIYVCLELHYKGGFQHIFCQCDTHLFIEGEFWKRGILSPMLPERGRKIDDLILHSRLICNCVRGKQQDKRFQRFLSHTHTHNIEQDFNE